MFSNRLKVVRHHDHKKYADVAYYCQHDQNKIPKIESIFNKLLKNIYFIGFSVDGLHTVERLERFSMTFTANGKRQIHVYVFSK